MQFVLYLRMYFKNPNKQAKEQQIFISIDK